MKLTNYHSHSFYDDGKGQLSDYADSAIAKEFYALGFSGHSPVPFDSVWNMKFENLLKYLLDARQTQKVYSDRLKIFVGLEIDYIKGLCTPDNFKIYNLDFYIGGVHYLETYENGDYWNIDTSPQEYEKGIREVFGGDIRKAVKGYYSAVSEMASNYRPDIIAHFDMINKFNQSGTKNIFFNEDEKWYQDLALESLEVVKQSGCILEVNTGAFFKKITNSFYPNTWLIKKCHEMNIPFTINDDAHSPEQLNTCHLQVVDLLESVGYKELFVFDEKGWYPVSLKC